MNLSGKHISPSLHEVCEKQEPLSSEEALRFAESEMSHAVDSVNAFISALSGDSPHDDLAERVASQKQAILDVIFPINTTENCMLTL